MQPMWAWHQQLSLVKLLSGLSRAVRKSPCIRTVRPELLQRAVQEACSAVVQLVQWECCHCRGSLHLLQVGQAMYVKAGELGLPVGHMPFKGFLLHVDEIEQLLQQYPGTKAIIDHCGFCQCSNLESQEWQRLLALAKYPQVLHSCTIGFLEATNACAMLVGVTALLAYKVCCSQQSIA